MYVLQVLPQRGGRAEDVAAQNTGRPAEMASLEVAERAGRLVHESADVAAVATCQRRPKVSSWRWRMIRASHPYLKALAAGDRQAKDEAGCKPRCRSC